MKNIILNIVGAFLTILGAAFFFGSIIGFIIFGAGWVILGLIMMIIGFWIINRNSEDIYFC